LPSQKSKAATPSKSDHNVDHITPEANTANVIVM